MGVLHYGATGEPIRIDDRALAHLKVAIATKLRRRESFTLSWKHGDDEDPGRETIWLHPSIPLRFVFDDPEPPDLNPAWIQALMLDASSSGGICLVDEHDAIETGARALSGGGASGAIASPRGSRPATARPR